MTSKLITLEAWAQQTYGEHAPSIPTLRRWARDARIHPAPEKHGRSYFVRPDARYVDITAPAASVTAAPASRRPLLSRLIDGGKAA